MTLKEGFRESAESWYEALVELEKRGLNEPALAIAEPIRVRILGGITESLATDEGATLLAAQNAEYLEQIAETRTLRGNFEIAGDLPGK